jgi:hypothetical protein
MPFSSPTGNLESASRAGARLVPMLAIAGLIMLAFPPRLAAAPDKPSDSATAEGAMAAMPAPAGRPLADSAATDSAAPAPATAAPAIPASDTAAVTAPAADTTGIASPVVDTATIAAPPGIAAPGPAAVEISIPPEEDDGFVVEVDPGQSVNKDKSLPLAMLFSAAMPGAGEYYLQEKGHAKAFLLAEAGFWAALYISFVSRDSYLQNARNYASEYAGIDASEKSAAFLETMANYRSYQEKQHRQDSYELAQILSGKRNRDYDIAPTEENDWDFGSSANPRNTDNWRTFQSTLRYYRASKVAISFAVGFLALNRLASLANTLNLYKRTSVGGTGLRIVPEIGPDYTGTRVSLSF